MNGKQKWFILENDLLYVKNDIYLLVLLLIAVMADHYFSGLTPLPGFVCETIEVACCAALVFFVFLSDHGQGIMKEFKFPIFYLLIVIAFGISQLVYTGLRYQLQTIPAFMVAIRPYAVVILCFFLIYEMVREREIDFILDFVTGIVIFHMAFMLLTAVIYNGTGRAIFFTDLAKQFITRNDRLRIWDMSSLEALACIWLGFKAIYYKEKRILNTALLGLLILVLFYVEQTRGMQISIFLALTVMFLLKPMPGKLAVVAKILAIIAVIAVGAYTGLWIRIVENFSTTGEESSSTVVRLEEMAYAIKLFFKNPINGMGLLIPDIREYYSEYDGTGMRMAFSDIGIIGMFGQLGIWAFLLYVVPVFRFAYILVQTKNSKDPDVAQKHAFLIALFAFLIVSSLTLLILDKPRAFMWPFCIALYEYYYYLEKQQHPEKKHHRTLLIY